MTTATADGPGPEADAAGRRWPDGLGVDLLGMLLVVLGNPVLWKVGRALRGYSSPDAAAYGSLARVMVSDGRLYLESWGYADQGVILPPLLPALTAFAGVFTDDPLREREPGFRASPRWLRAWRSTGCCLV